MASKPSNKESASVWYAVAVARVMLGFIFLWAFFDKLLGLGLATPSERAWINGGSPTTGFLNGVDGTFAGLFNAMAGHAWADWLFMVGLAAIGTALVLGIGIRLATVGGSVLLGLMWLAALPLSNNPWVDDHLVYVALLWIVYFGYGQQKLSLATQWRQLTAKMPWLW